MSFIVIFRWWRRDCHGPCSRLLNPSGILFINLCPLSVPVFLLLPPPPNPSPSLSLFLMALLPVSSSIFLLDSVYYDNYCLIHGTRHWSPKLFFTGSISGFHAKCLVKFLGLRLQFNHASSQPTMAAPLKYEHESRIIQGHIFFEPSLMLSTLCPWYC